MPSHTINIIGNGSMGHLWAAHLLRRKYSVNLFGRSPKPNRNYRLTSSEQCFDYQLPILTIKDWQRADWTLVCVKAGSLISLCKQLSRLQAPATYIVLMMNGLGLTKIVNKELPNSLVYQASTSHGAYRAENKLVHTGTGRTLIGNIAQTDTSAICNPIGPLIKVLNEALPETIWNCNHQHTLWKKLLVNSVINPLTTLYATTNGAINDDQQVKQHAVKLTKELEPIIRCYLPTESWQSIWQEIRSIARRTAHNRSSMLQDIEANKASEIEFITGYLLTKARYNEIVLKEHQQIFDQIRAMEHIIE